MANGKEKLAKKWKDVLSDLFRRNPDHNAPQLWEVLKSIFGEAKTPGLNSIQKELVEIKKRYEKVKQEALDMPWHLGVKPEHDIPPTAVPYILLVQSFAEQYPDLRTKETQEPVTIRQAQWIARLYAMVGDIHKFKDKKKKKLSAAAFLYDWSKLYATHEIICYLSGNQYDTYELDKALREGAHPVVVGRRYLIFYPDRSFFSDPKTYQEYKTSVEKESEK